MSPAPGTEEEPFWRKGRPVPVRHYLGAAVVAGAYVAVDQLHKGPVLLATVDDDARSNLYISLAASTAALLGFAIASASILSALGSGTRVTWLRQQDEFLATRDVLMGVMRALAVATLLYTVLIVADTGSPGSAWWEAAGAAVGTIVVVRIGWLLWLLDHLLRLSMKDEAEETTPDSLNEFDEPDDPE